MRILGISGKKQSGKNTFANYINGRVMLSMGMIRDFYVDVDNKGELVIETTNASGEIGWGVFDVTRKDHGFTEYAERELWPYVKLYSFADGLKSLCMEFFGLSPEQVYGTDEHKNTTTEIKWEDVPTWENSSLNKNRGNMTARELMQYFGTDIMRRMYEPVHINHALNKVKSEQSQVAIIPDVRFPNEVEAIKKAGGNVVRLTRVFNEEDSHPSETALDEENFDWGNFDFVLENNCPAGEFIPIVEQFYNKNFI